MGSALLASCASNTQTSQMEKPKSQITVIYDAFGKDPAMKKDWGYAALVEVGGKRILFESENLRPQGGLRHLRLLATEQLLPQG